MSEGLLLQQRYTVDIDVGGTMTDGLFSDGRSATAVKVDTTPHDLTVCLLDCLREGSSQLGFAGLDEFLEQVEAIRWSSTIATNVLAERKGPKLGLLVSPSGGRSSDLYGDTPSPAVGQLLPAEAIVEVGQPAAREDVVSSVKWLLERGVRRICVSLAGSFHEPGGETAIKRIIEEQYPDHSLGAVPVLLGSEICHHPDDRTRTHYALMNAYVHGPLAASLFKAEEDLMLRHGYRRPLLIGHIDGGVARVAKTTAIDTVESGPIFGLFGSVDYARRYGLPHVISLDVGGTTVKVGIIVNGEPLLTREPSIFGIDLKLPMLLLDSIPLGGGSVVHADRAGGLRLGPESMGAYPGPACYDVGGAEATLTDALVVLGRINPASFLGGTRWLNADRAREAIAEKVAGPLGLAVEAAARRVDEAACRLIAGAIRRSLAEHGLAGEDFVLFAFGGNGPLFAARTAELLGVRQVYTFALGAVFSTFGSSISAVSHAYEHALFEPLTQPSLDRLAAALPGMVEAAFRDMASEGFRREQVRLALELEARAGEGPVRTLRTAFAPDAEPAGRAGLEALVADLRTAPGSLETVQVERLRLKATAQIATYSPVPHHAEQDNVAGVPSGERPVYWNQEWPEATSVYEQPSLGSGSVVNGPAVIEGSLTTYGVPPGWRFTVDPDLNGKLART